MIANGAWTAKEDFLAGEIGGHQKAVVIQRDDDLAVIESCRLPTYETIHDSIPERVAFTSKGTQYWTFG
jgi:hypothetical protein